MLIKEDIFILGLFLIDSSVYWGKLLIYSEISLEAFLFINILQDLKGITSFGLKKYIFPIIYVENDKLVSYFYVSKFNILIYYY